LVQEVWTVVILAAYTATLVFVALRARAAKEFVAFSLAKRRLALGLVFGSLSAAYVGPAFAVGFVGKGFMSGFLFVAVGLAYAAQNILVGLCVAPRLRGFGDCHTLGDVAGKAYGRPCQLLAGIVSVGLCAGFSAVMAKAAGSIARDVFGTHFWVGVLIVTTLTCMYTTFGGLRASVVTDDFQFATFAILLPAMFLWILAFKVPDGGTGFVRQAVTATREGWGAASWPEVLGLVVAFLLGETLIPPYANRALASRTTQVSQKSFLQAGAFSVIWFTVMAGLGIAARGIVLSGTNEDSVLVTLVTATMPPVWHAMLLVVLTAIIMSSLDSLLNAGAVCVSRDLVGTMTPLSDRGALYVGRGATVGIAVAAAGAAVLSETDVPGIIDGLLVCYNLWAPAILPAVILGLWIKRTRPAAGVLSILAGAGSAAAMELPALKARVEVTGIPSIVLALTVGLFAYAVGHWLVPHRGEEICSTR
jgi:SSS family solute:Na+ symporter